MTGIIHRAMDHIAEKVEAGDASLRDLTTSAAILMDKRQMHRAGGSAAQLNHQRALADLAREFIRIGQESRGVVIDATVEPQQDAGEEITKD